MYFLSYNAPVRRTIRMRCTFWEASSVRVSEIVYNFINIIVNFLPIMKNIFMYKYLSGMCKQLDGC